MKSGKGEVRTMRKFLRVFRSLPQKFWIDRGGYLRVKWHPESCPVIAVCEQVTGVKYAQSDNGEAVRAMGFPMWLANRIMAAADDMVDIDNKRGSLRLRRRLLEAKGLL